MELVIVSATVLRPEISAMSGLIYTIIIPANFSSTLRILSLSKSAAICWSTVVLFVSTNEHVSFRRFRRVCDVGSSRDPCKDVLSPVSNTCLYNSGSGLLGLVLKAC